MTGRATALLGLALAFSGCAPPPPPDAASAPGLPVAVLNDVRTSAGRLENGALVVALDVVDAAWTPRGPDGPRIAVPAFAERGQAPVVPAPLIRLSAGTPLRLTIRNTRAEPVTFGSLLDDADYPGASGVQLEPGETREVHWTPKAPVSSTYGLAATEGPPGASIGAIVVDPAGTQPHPDERVLLLSSWGSPAEPTSLDPAFSWKMLVNGRSWPHTERFEFTVGDTVRWRVINASPEWHPMHLHGFYFRVTSTGDSRADTVFDASTSQEVVTHTLAPAGTMSLTFVPSEPGNWLFHCHLLRHMGPTQRFAGDATHGEDAAHGDESDGSTTMEDGMAGMIVGITVRATPGSSEMVEAPARRLDLWTASQPGVFGDAPRLAFVQQEGDVVPPSDSAPTLSSLLVLEQNQTVEIEVHNRLTGPLSVHWHGLELKSQYDGVGHWSGMPGMPRPPIPPGGTALVHLKPPRAGTFIYHTHGEDGSELAQGLYGPLIVLPPGEAYDGERDRIFVLGAGGVGRDADPAVNGVREPRPERFEAGKTYRLRFIQIGADEGKRIELRHEGAPVSWRAIAKDGADLAEPLRVTGPARVRADVGETYDFEWTPPSDGVYQLVVKTLSYPIDFDRGPTQTIAFAVGNVTAAAIDSAHEGFDGVVSVATINRLIQGAMVVVLALLVWGMWRLVRWVRRRRALAAS